MSQVTVNQNEVKQITFTIGQKEFKFLVKDQRLYAPGAENFIPSRLNQVCRDFSIYGATGAVFEDYLFIPYLKGEFFEVFMNLILTPMHEKVNIPHNMTIEDLRTILDKFTWNQTDKHVIVSLEKRFNDNKNALRTLLCRCYR